MSNRYIVGVYAKGETELDEDYREISLTYSTFREFNCKEDAFNLINEIHEAHGDSIMRGQLEPLRGKVYRFPSNEEIAPLVPEPYWFLGNYNLINQDYLCLFYNDNRELCLGYKDKYIILEEVYE